MTAPAPTQTTHGGRFVEGVDNRALEALIRRSPVPLDRETRREARRAGRSGVEITPALALSATLALKRGSRVVQLGDWDAAVVTSLLRSLYWGTDTPDNAPQPPDPAAR